MQGISGTSNKGPASIAAQQGGAVSSADMLGSGGAGVALNVEKDQKGDSTQAKFGDVWQTMQARYGKKAEKPKEIKKTLGKDDFLRIMVTQMKNQDPTNPFKADQFATQLAQFTQVEQLQNLNQGMTKMTAANQPLERLAMTNMIGKKVTIDRERFPHTENEASTLGYALAREAKEVKITVIGENGETMMTKELGAQKAGEQSFAWDGVRDNMQPAKSGKYIFRIEAKDVSGRPIEMNTKAQAKVVGVSFEGNEGVLLVGDPRNPQKVTMQNVVRVDTGGEESLVPGAQSLRAAIAQDAAARGGAVEPAGSGVEAVAAAPASPTSNMFTFEKGVGSKPLDMASAPAEVQRALQSYASARNSAEKEMRSANGAAGNAENSAEFAKKNEARGFPSGLNPGDTE